MKKSAALFFLCLTFARCVFADNAATNDNLIVAFQFLDDQWILDSQAYTGEYARIYKDALQTTKPPQYGTYLLDQNGNLVYTSVSQRELWDFLSSNSSYFNDEVQNDGDGLGDYIKVSWLATLFGAFSYNSNTGLCETRPLDHALTSTARRLSTLSVAQSPQEIEAISNATCNCDWTIVTNIYTTLLGFANGTTNALEMLNNRQKDIYEWLTGVDLISSNSNISFPDFLEGVYHSVSNIYTLDEAGISLLTNVLFQYYARRGTMTKYGFQLGLLDNDPFAQSVQEFIDLQRSYVLDAEYPLPFVNDNGTSSVIRNILLPLWLSAQGSTFASYFTAEQLDWMMNTLWPVQTNQSNIATALFTGDIQDKYSYLTNWYSNLADSNFNMPYTERLELLLAALVFAGDGGSDTNQTSFSDAETNAEDIKTQYVSLVNQLNQTILGDVKSNIERTDRSLLSFFQSLNSALDFQYQPNIHIIHNVDSNFGTDSLPNGFGIGDYWEFDLESNGVDTFIKFCRACTSIVILSGWLFIVWQLGRGTAKICWRMAVLAFKTCSKLLG